MKRVILILLSLVLCLAMSAPAFALEPPAGDDPNAWGRYAEQLAEDSPYEPETAEAYRKAGELYLAAIAEDEIYGREAMRCFGKAAELYRSLGRYGEAAECYELSGAAAEADGDYTEAIHRYESAITNAEETGSFDAVRGRCHEKRGDCYVKLEKTEEAAGAYKLALDRYEDTEPEYARIAVKYVNVLETTGKPEEIAAAYTKASNAAEYQGDRTLSLELLRKSIPFYRETDEPDAAERVFSRKVMQLAMDNDAAAAAELAVEFYETFGPSRQARSLLESITARYYDEIGDPVSLAYTCSLIADCDKELGETKEAAEYYTEAAKLYRKAGCTADAERMETLARECSALGTIFSGGNAVILVITGVLALAAIVLVVLKKKKNK